MSKQDQPLVVQKKLSYYDVKIETLLPATLTYKVLAESADEASELIKSKQPNQVSYKLIGKRDLKMTIYDMGSSIIRFMKRLS